MSSYVYKKITCKSCGNIYEAKFLKGFYNSYPLDLDTYPHNPAIFDKVVMCPACGYATDQIQSEVDPITETVVNSVPYQRLVNQENLPTALKKELLNAMLKEALGLYREAAFSYLRAYWYQRENRYCDHVTLAKIIKCLSVYLEGTMDIGAAIILIDCYRQHADFTEAKETAISLLSYIKEPGDKRIVDFELHLIDEGDKNPHSQSEVPV